MKHIYFNIIFFNPNLIPSVEKVGGYKDRKNVNPLTVSKKLRTKKKGNWHHKFRFRLSVYRATKKVAVRLNEKGIKSRAN